MSDIIWSIIHAAIVAAIFTLLCIHYNRKAYARGVRAGVEAGFKTGVALERAVGSQFTKLTDSFDKNAKTPSEAIMNSEYYAKLGEMGISPQNMASLNESIAKIKAFEDKCKKDREDAETK
jgi:hypothetical protein